MRSVVELLLWAGSVSIVMAQRRPLIPDTATIVQRFDGDLPMCRERQVCADIFNAPRLQDDGSRVPETRVIYNCMCPGIQCGFNNEPFVFNETLKQSMTTCEDASHFEVCSPGEIAKEQHNLYPYVYYKLNCVCPNNDRPQNFFNKMTETMYRHELPDDINQQGYSRTRYFKCRE